MVLFFKFTFLFHLKKHHSKDVSLKFWLKWSSHLDVRSNFVYCSCLYLTVSVLIMVTITRHVFITIFQMEHFSTVIFVMGYKKNGKKIWLGSFKLFWKVHLDHVFIPRVYPIISLDTSFYLLWIQPGNNPYVTNTCYKMLFKTSALLLRMIWTEICSQGRNRHIFLRGQSNFSCFFPVENFHFGWPKTNVSHFKKCKGERKKKGPRLFEICSHKMNYKTPGDMAY